ncbi:MAG: ABC transporter ATP-binding protein [Terracidiphilus sp.]|jgi:lipoprotein-releasing system ATP-binding protein
MIETSPAAAPQATRQAREPELRAGAGGGQSQAHAQSGQTPIIEVSGLEKTYRTARGALNLFHGLDLQVESGEMVAIVGQSGAGKSTLLHILGALDAPSAGTVNCASTDVARLSAREAAAFRNREIGYVWQFHYLLPEFTALENVAMPLLARGKMRTGVPSNRSSSLGWKVDALQTAANWLREVGLEDRADHRPGELSGGEQQRVALARALVNNPRLLLADEPTGDLDEITAGRVFDLIERLHLSHGLTSILVTHNPDLAARCGRILRLEGGRLAPLATAQQVGFQAGSR